MPQKLSRIQIIDRAHEVHGYKYIYDKMEYVGMNTKSCMICKEHGEFWQTPTKHISGQGCPECAKIRLREFRVYGKDKFLEKAREVHGNKYIYDENKLTYISNKEKVCITCKIHGDFWQKAENHLQGHGCPECGGVIKSNTDEFIAKAEKVHKGLYIYNKDKLNYISAHSTVCITCRIHGDFWQEANHHLHGVGCPKCANNIKHTIEFFIEKARQVHGDDYIYSDTEYINNRTPLKIICKKHGPFWQIPKKHLIGHGCPICGNNSSKMESEIDDFINKNCSIKTIRRNRKLLGKGLECDIVIPSLKLIIEFNGLYWHSEAQGKGKNYHLHKTELAESKGYHLIHIFEDEWLEYKDIVLSKIRHFLGKDLNKSVIGARKCVIKTVSKTLAEPFFNTYHLQGFVASTVYYGAFYGDVLVGVMAFKKEKEGIWNFNRFATNTDYRLPGLASKIFKQFIKDYEPVEVKAFLDRRWTHCDCNLYIKMGFKLIETITPNYWYIIEKKRAFKSKFNKRSLAKEHNFPLSMTEKEMAEKLGYYRIWDCGQCKYIWKPSTYM